MKAKSYPCAGGRGLHACLGLVLLLLLLAQAVQAAQLSRVELKPGTVVGGNTQPFRLIIRLDRRGTMNLKLHSSDLSLVNWNQTPIRISNRSSVEIVKFANRNTSNHTQFVNISVTSGAVTKTVTLRVKPYETPPDPMIRGRGTRIHSITGRQLFALMQDATKRGYIFRARRIGGHGPGICKIADDRGPRNYGLMFIVNIGAHPGNFSINCKIEIMEGDKRLRPGWTLYSVDIDHSYYGYKLWEYASRPRYGTDDPGFTLRVKHQSKRGRLFDYQFYLKAIRLRGPQNGRWQDALLD